jgi:hypothetical protein
MIGRVRELYFIGRKAEWNNNNSNPTIRIIKSFGCRGNIEVECEALLRENDCMTDDFGDDCTQEMSILRE